MEADWEFDIGGDAPVIDAAWSGLVDLRTAPERINEIPEATSAAGLAGALGRLNAETSPVWTCKCDVWPLQEFDRDELDAGPDQQHAMACYIDLLPRRTQAWTTPDEVAQWCRLVCDLLHRLPLPAARADLVIRTAVLASGKGRFGVTTYFAAAASSESEAVNALSFALQCSVPVIAETPLQA